MAHDYVCSRCGRRRVCAMQGCQGDCVKTCVPCLRGRSPKPVKPRSEQRRDIIERYGDKEDI